ncbi:MAG: hypothetical protein H7Y42_09105 [Chitinophagaceae bacterium]|nr:hypothetical protein [Chitinophagaceae bacterium]
MAGQPIPISTAEDMIKDYITYMRDLGVDMANQTQSVTFTGTDLMDWLNQVMPQADELRIFMGMYPHAHPHAGRTTVILWPYKNGQPANESMQRGGGPTEPFNEGTGQP